MLEQWFSFGNTAKAEEVIVFFHIDWCQVFKLLFDDVFAMVTGEAGDVWFVFTSFVSSTIPKFHIVQ